MEDFSQLSDEQILAEIQRLNSLNAPEPKVAAPVQEEPKPQVSQPTPIERPEPQAPVNLADIFKPGKYDHDQYAKLLVKDAGEAQDYLETARYGQPVSKLIPALVQGFVTQTQKLKDLEAQRFLDTVEDYKPSVENQKILDSIITERGWSGDYRSLKDAWAIAKSEGLVKTEPKHAETKQSTQRETPYVPPRPASRSNLTQEDANPDILKWAENAPLDDLHALLQKNGGFRH